MLGNAYIPFHSDGVTLLDGYAVTVSTNSMPLYLNRVYGFSVTVSFPNTGTPVGTLKLQASNDTEKVLGVADASITNWADIANSSTAITGTSSPILWNYNASMYRWIRVVYVATSGTLTMSTRIQIKALAS